MRTYKNDNYVIFKARGGYVVYNKQKPFKHGHTHLKDFNTAKYLVHLSRHKEIPAHLSKYLWVSLERISVGKDYCKKLRCIIDELSIVGR